MSLYVRNSALAWKNVPEQDGKLYVHNGLGWKKVKSLYVRRFNPDTTLLEWKLVGRFAAPDAPVGYELHQDGAGPSGFPERWRVFTHLHAGMPSDASSFATRFQRSAGGTGPWEDVGSWVNNGTGNALYSDYVYDATNGDKARAYVWLSNTAGSTAEYATGEITTTEFAPYP